MRALANESRTFPQGIKPGGRDWLARPRRKTTGFWRKVRDETRITFLLDSSWSMKMGEDVEPNRLAAAKERIEYFVDALWFDPMLKGNYAVALIPFAGAAEPLFLPFTTSRDQFLSHLGQIDERTITKKGTSLWAALRAYDELLLSRPAREKGTLDLGILISDGGKEEGKGTEQRLLPNLMHELLDPYRIAAKVNDAQIIVRSDMVNMCTRFCPVLRGREWCDTAMRALDL